MIYICEYLKRDTALRVSPKKWAFPLELCTLSYRARLIGNRQK